MPVDRDKFRRLSGAFPTGVVIVATLDAEGLPKGLTSQAYIGASTDPPLMLVGVDKTSRTLPHLQRHRRFVVNFLREGSEDVATLFASKSDEKFRDLAWEPSARAGGAPILRAISTAYAECALVDAIEAGDHWLFVASVEGGEELGGAPLMYYRRTYAAWPLERPAPPVEGAG